MQQETPRAAALPSSREKSWGFRCCVVHGNMAANIRGRPIRSLRMRGKPLKLGSAWSLWALRCTINLSRTWNNPGAVPHHVCCVWQVGMTAGKRTSRWTWAEVKLGFDSDYCSKWMCATDGGSTKGAAFGRRFFFFLLAVLLSFSHCFQSSFVQ